MDDYPVPKFRGFPACNCTEWSYSELTVLVAAAAAAAAAAMESATIITTLTLLCSINQHTLFAHSNSSKRMLMKFSITNIEIRSFWGYPVSIL
jgi:hypothetical protein